MAEEDDDLDRVDDLVRLALDGHNVHGAFELLTQGSQDEFILMLEAQGGSWSPQAKTEKKGNGATVPNPQLQGSAVVAEFLDAYWRDRSDNKNPSLSHYLTEYPGDVEGVARCFLVLSAESGSGDGVNSQRSQVGSYSLGDVLGRGGQATVYLARDQKLRRTVALKIFEGSMGIGTRALARFQREARAVSKLDHPGIGRIFEANVIDGLPFIAMEYVEGESLARFIAREKVQSDSETSKSARKHRETCVQILREVAEALAAAHSEGVIHRDLKPANIMLRPDGSPVLLDFGLAKIEDDDVEGVSGTLDLLGTPAYIAPERLRNPSIRATRLEDLYAFGVTAFELLSGKRPFEAPTVDQLYRRKLSGDMLSLVQVSPSTPKDLAVVIATAMELEPACRYQDAGHLAEDLARVAEGEPVSVRPLTAIVRGTRWYRRNALVATLSLIILVSLVVFSWTTWRKNNRIEDLRESAEARGNELAQSLGDILELSDVKRVDDLIESADTLWPVGPDIVPRMEDWLKRAYDVSLRGESHEIELVALRAKKIPMTKEATKEKFPVLVKRIDDMMDQFRSYSDGSSGLDDEAAKQALSVVQLLEARRLAACDKTLVRYKDGNYPEAADGWRAEILERLSKQLKVLGSEDQGLIQVIEHRLQASKSLRHNSIDAHLPAWESARVELKSDERFRDFELEPIIGFVPLGQDPNSGLQEFLHLFTHQEKAIPARDDQGNLPALTEKTGFIMVLVPGGSFQMGAELDRGSPHFDPMASPVEGPRHQIKLDPFLISKYEAWQSAWMAIAGSNPSAYKPGSRVLEDEVVNGLHPVEFVSWYEARKVLWRVDMNLPTEAQWEYAARGGKETIWEFGDNPQQCATKMNIADKQLLRLVGKQVVDPLHHDDGWALHGPVDLYQPNQFGLYQVHGNVHEWCLDSYAAYASPVRKGDGFRLASVNGNDTRMFRSGAYCYGAEDARYSARSGAEAASQNEMVGLRPIFTLPQSGKER